MSCLFNFAWSKSELKKKHEVLQKMETVKAVMKVVMRQKPKPINV